MHDALVARALALPEGARHLIALAGPPASGKSTQAEGLAADLCAAGRRAVVVPMDGFHLDNRLLEARGLQARKGAPETFDLRGFARLMQDLQQGGDVIYPVFDRGRDLAIAGAGQLDAACDLVVVEGNYLLFDAPGWRDLAQHWALSVYLEVAEAVLRARLIGRWTDHGLSHADAVARAEANDLPNAARLMAHRLPADMVIADARA